MPGIKELSLQVSTVKQRRASTLSKIEAIERLVVGFVVAGDQVSRPRTRPRECTLSSPRIREASASEPRLPELRQSVLRRQSEPEPDIFEVEGEIGLRSILAEDIPDRDPTLAEVLSELNKTIHVFLRTADALASAR
jgi:hypothetical protein